MRERLVERLWYGDGVVAAAARAALIPLERVFGGIGGARDLRYDAGWLHSEATRLPAVSVGNLTVGGTGKTPIAAWIARLLAARGARPAIVLRGYGADEIRVHEMLNPTMPVIAGADRVAAVARAADAGADIAVLDDAFQHRRARRAADFVLVSADRWTANPRLLPAGPWREPLGALRRATMAIVTRKAADDSRVAEVHARLSAAAPHVPRVSVALVPSELVRVDERGQVVQRRALETLAGRSVDAVLSIADPNAFIRQLEARGARVRPRIFPDHHRFTQEEITRLVSDLHSAELVVCTLKDAVKLAPQWPRLAPGLWYVSQQVMVERGVGGVERVLDDLVRGRSRSANAG
jgi:tetraacyldisaccharide 4'-kinase